MYETLKWSAVLLTLAGCGDPAVVALPGESELVELRTEMLDLPGLGLQEVTYELVDGQAIFQGDILLDLDNLRVNSDGVSTRGSARRNEAARWAAGVVPFKIDPAVPNPSRVKGATGAPGQFGTTSVTFVDRASEADYVMFRKSTRTDQRLCFSAIGRVGGMQTIEVGDLCSQDDLVHEIGHALGLWHEQSRFDRDNFVTIKWDNIAPVNQPQFQTYSAQGSDGWENGLYDYTSRMHYPGDQFAIDPAKPTIVRKDGKSALGPIQPGLSPGDVTTINRMYPSFNPSGSPLIPSNFGGAISSWGQNRLDMYAVATDGSLRHQYCDGGPGPKTTCKTGAEWSGWVDNWGNGGLALTGGVDAVSWGVNRIDAVVRASNNSVWHFWYDSGARGWEDLGMQMRAGADCSISSWSARNLDVFCVGTDNKLKHKAHRSATGWSGWENLSGVLTAGVDSTSWGPNRIDIVSRNSSSHLVHMAWDGSSWSSFVDRGGSLAGTPTISSGVVNAGGRLDIFALFNDGSIQKRSYEQGWNVDFDPVLTVGSEPDAVSWFPSRIDMAIRTSGYIQHVFTDNWVR